MVTRDEVIWCYRLILGREPESEEAIAHQQQYEDLETLRAFFLQSSEYKEKISIQQLETVEFKTIPEVSNTVIQKTAPINLIKEIDQSDREEKWIVISNCQTVGIANSLSLLCANVTVEPCDIWQLTKNREYWEAKLPEYDQLIILADIRHINVIDLSPYQNITWFPSFLFRAFHPDLCYVTSPDGHIKTPMDEYNSCLAFAAYKSNLTIDQTRNLYNNEVYQAVGFYNFWQAEKEQLFRRFDDFDLDIRNSFVQWARQGSFMYSGNHPKVNAIYDIATLIARKIRGKHFETTIRPHDNLAVGPIYPIYPEIAENLGLKDGSYLFKPISAYKLFDLDEFLEGSFGAYEKYNADALMIHDQYVHPYENAMKYIAERKYEQSI
ncbi:WcbI family polysaccharide biosynthesis putative acetyltransferase [Aquirhabdus sp.]|uniref:WcbI family polysaccharide biosynthesis putative acetyltransferase n=1 Tax=Aquirhabdus sp. TaxID=2824160 RepID=UPI00396CA20F